MVCPAVITIFLFSVLGSSSSQNCDFEDVKSCKWTQYAADKFDWSRASGSTGSTGTGPVNDHTTLVKTLKVNTTGGNANGASCVFPFIYQSKKYFKCLQYYNTEWCATVPNYDKQAKWGYCVPTGFYMFIEASNPRKKGDNAILVSPFVPKGPKCLKFWYHMYGPHIDTLNVYKKVSNNMTKLWSLTGTQGNRWISANVTFNGGSQFQMAIEAIRGVEYKGDIAIDDITVDDGSCNADNGQKGNVTSYGKCTFEKDKCGFKDGNTSTLTWTRHKGKTPSKGTGPLVDHTFGTGLAYYMYVEASNNPMQSARLYTTYTNLDSTGSCLSFWYHMFGPRTGELKVYINPPEIGKEIPSFSVGGEQGNLWIRGEVTVNTTTALVVFEGTTKYSYLGDLAIDDVSMERGKCEDPDSCSFQKDLCAWYNLPKSSGLDDFDWIVGAGVTPSRFTGPTSDHNGDIAGKYLFMESSSPVKMGDKTWLSSELFNSTGKGKCFVFFYHMYGRDVGSLNIYVNTSSGVELVWTQSRSKGKQWQNGQVDVERPGTYKVLVEGVVGKGYLGDIAIDDFKFKPGKCQIVPSNASPKKPQTTMRPTTKRPTQPPTPILDCDFEFGVCSDWRQDYKNDTDNWKVGKGTTSTAGTGPSFDHTKGTIYGKYIYLEASYGRLNETARLISTSIPATGDTGGKCLTFWYHMYGPHINRLNIYVMIGGHTGKPIWSRVGTQGNKWNKGQVTLVGRQPFQAVIEAVKGAKYQGDIAVDDVSLSSKKCPQPGATTCTFENSQCGYIDDTSSDVQFQWTWQSQATSSLNTGPKFDHTLQSVSGFYMYTEASNAKQGDKARLISPVNPGTSGSCLKFWYHMYGAGMGTLSVRLLVNNKLQSVPLWSETGNKGNEWKVATTTIKTKDAYQVVFQGVIGTTYASDMAIDDVKLSDGECQSPGFCNFEDGLCTYANSKTDDFDWLVGSSNTPSSFTGPKVDHTFGNASGSYLFLEVSKPIKAGDVAVLESQQFNAVGGKTRCLNFWYHMYGSDIGTLQVIYKVFSGSQQERVLWKLTGQQQITEKDPWKYARVPVDMDADHMVMFKGIAGSGYAGDIAIDDIQFTTLACRVEPSIANPTPTTPKPPTTFPKTAPPTAAPTPFSCNFEKDFCSLTSDSTAVFNWTRSQGYTASQNTGPSTDHTYGRGFVKTYGPGSIRHAAGMCIHISMGGHTKPKDETALVLYNGCGQDRTEFKYDNGLIKSTQYNMCFKLKGASTSAGTKVVISDTCTNKWKMLANGAFQDAKTNLCLAPSGKLAYPQNNSPLIVSKDCKAKGVIFTFSPTMGFYALIEASAPQKPNDTARLISPVLNKPKCLSFWYHMYGANINQLNVYTKSPNGVYGNPVWSKFGSHGDKWRPAHVYMNPKSSSYAYAIEGVRGNGYEGDIAIDDVSVSDKCPAPVECTFEETNPVACGWTNLKTDDFDWSIGQGATSSQNTGPSNDHTYNDQRGKYLYIETSSNLKAGAKALIQSPVYRGNGRQQGQCFQFWYHMYGASIGRLSLHLDQVGSTTKNRAWIQESDQGNRWSIGQITIKSQAAFQLTFEGIRGKSFTGDIALDDFRMFDGPCNNIATCDFENEKCTWKNSYHKDDFDWIIGQGTTLSLNTGPVTDHSTNSGDGHYIFIDASRKKQGAKARLYSEIIPRGFFTFIPYCIYFWYHMSGPDIGTLNLIAKHGKGKALEKVIWSLSGNQGSKWLQGTAPVTSSVDFHLVFEAIVGDGYKGDITLDDIVYKLGLCSISPKAADPKLISTTSAPTPIPTTAVPAMYDCNFEKNSLCQWKQDLTDQFNWTLVQGQTPTLGSGPSVDHTTGNKTGYYLFIETSNPRKAGDKARILSPSMDSDKDHGHPHCLKFWFHMYGPHVDTLNVYKKVSGSLQLVWTRVGDNGDQWKYAQVDMTSKYSYQAVIEGVRGSSYKGDISIDDIVLADNACPPPLNCDFEHGKCGYVEDPLADFDWTRNKGETTSVGTGPPFDHTYQTNQGYYMYAEASGRRKNGDKALLVGPVLPGSAPMCLEFWFHMRGWHIGQLNVYIKTSNGGKVLIWRRSGNHGMQWKIGRVTVRPRSGRQIVFEAIRGLSFSGDIAIDDIKTVSGYCPPPGDCSFEKGMCSWNNVKRTKLEQFDWILGSGDPYRFNDHTSGKLEGKYVYIESSAQGQGDRAWLISEDFYPTNGRCVQFWAYMSGTNVGDLNVYIRDQNGTNSMIWTLSGQQGRPAKWFNGHAPIYSSGDYQIVFEAVRGGGSFGFIGLDDILFTSFRCNNLPLNSVPPVTTKAPPTTLATTQPPTPAPNYYTCNFTYDYCNWHNDSTAHFNWTRHQGSTASIQTGPSGDHTTGRSGWYIFLETSYPRKANDTARLISDDVPATSIMCLQFWYHMYGDHIGNLTAYTKVGSKMTKLWTKSGTYGPRWRHATVDISSASTFKVVIEGTASSGYMGDIALDDLFLNNGACPPSGECSFEDPKLCGWTNMNGDNFDWTRDNAGTSSSGTGPRFDHTYGTAQGFYVYIEASNPRSKGHKAWLKSGEYKPTLGRCLSFWYHMYGSHVGELNVLVLQNKSRSAPIWNLKGNQGNVWRPSRVTIKSAVNHNIIFEGRTGDGYMGDIAIDDVMMSEGPCTDYGNCDFERDLCGYTNKKNIDQFDWQLGSGGTSSVTTGPSNDHSTQTALGQYMFVESSYPRLPHETAIIGSETIPVSGSGKCLQFWYHMYGEHIGSLEVNMRVANDLSETIVWKLEGNQGNKWLQGQAPLLSRGQNMEVRFEGIRGTGYKGDIAIDDITVVDYSGACAITPKSAKPWGCNFELDFCKWQQSRADKFDWLRNQGATGSAGTGPKADHTTNTTQGYYAYVETSFPRQPNDTAAIISPTIKGNGTKQTYCMWFAYHMYGPHVDTLKVYTRSQGSDKPVLWRRRGSQGLNWNHAEVQVTVLYDTKVIIEAVRGKDYKGDIAIDDIDIWFGDCFSSGICTFEGADLCFWYVPKNGQLYWQRASGATPSVKTGPKNDHTYGTSQGHYMYIETSNAPAKATAYMYSPWYYNTGQKCVQFFYHMYGQQIGQLEVYIRYSNSRYLYRQFIRSGNQNNTWHMGQVTVKRNNVYFQIIVRGTKGNGYQGDIAVDDFRIRDGACPAPGDCDFEHADFCSWMQEDNDDFDWIIGSGSTNSFLTGPSIDHTTQSNGGYYAFIEASSPRQPGHKARFKSMVFAPTTGSGRCFSFWYHMRGYSIGNLTIYLRKVSNTKTLSEEVMWLLGGNQGKAWNQGRFTLKSSTLHEVVIEGVRGSSYDGDIGIDDIEFTSGSCSFLPKGAWPSGRSTPAPTQASTTLGPTIGNKGFDCNFDKEFCKTWMRNSTRTNFQWKRHQGSTSSVGTGPHHDHTTNTDQGYYVYIESSSPAQPNDTAYLIGKDIPNNNGFCLSYWYHMYGPHVGSFRVYVVNKTNAEARFVRVGTQGDKWKHGQLYISPKAGNPITIRFEGVRGSSFMGDIALDDISVRYGNQCPAPRECTFEHDNNGGSSSTCGWTQEKQKDSFDWSIGSGDTPSVLTGPNFDHTLETKQGHYFYIETSYPRKFGENATIISQSYQQTLGKCFSFWYHMYGSTIGNLTLFLRRDNKDTLLWAKSKPEGNQWRPALVTVNSWYKPFQLIFVGTVGKSYFGDIAIDDLMMTDEKCPSPGDCDFEDFDKCTYTQDLVEDDFDWIRGHGGTGSWRTGPSLDNTKKDNSGHYYFIEASAPRTQGDRARLVSELFDPTSSTRGRCLQFYRHMYGTAVGTLNVYVKTGPGNSSDAESLVWTNAGNQGNSWIQGQVPIYSSKPFRLVFEAVRGNGYAGDIAIDDINFNNNFAPCSFLPSNAAPPTLPPTTITPEDSNCTFDKGLCRWKQMKSNDQFDWTLVSGSTGSVGTGPLGDHTSGKGSYIYIEASYPRKENDSAILQSPPIRPSLGSVCFKFAYHMHGAHVNALYIYKNVKGKRTMVWKRVGTQGNQWRNGQVNIRGVSGIFNIEMKGIRGVDYQGDISLDDFVVTNGQCPTPSHCDFENNQCGWFNIGRGDDFNWKRSNGGTPSLGTGPGTDHTTGVALGSYMFIETSYPRKYRDVANLYSPYYPGSKTGYCFNFWYHMYGSHIGSLNLYQDTVKSTPIWNKTDNQGNMWKHGRVTVNSRAKFRLIFVGTVGKSFLGDIALDDVWVDDFPCPAPGACDFESKSFCTWSQVPNKFNTSNYDDFDWELGNGPTPSFQTGPAVDHTKGTSVGTYAYVEVSGLIKRGQKAQLMSEKFPPTNGKCMSFWYHMYGSGVGDLNIYLKYLGVKKSHLVKSISGQQGNKWIQGEVGLHSQKDFNVIIEAVKGSSYAGDISLDDISILDGNCVGLCSSVQPVARVACGPQSVTSASCVVSYGCCYDNSVPNVPACFQHPSSCKAVPIIARQQCGYYSISKYFCARRGCCFDDSGAGGPPCYHSLSKPTDFPTTRAPPTTQPPSKFDCNFEKNQCQYTNLRNDQFNWARHKGDTASFGTGPKFDHTLRNQNGHYMFVETSFNKENDTANLGTPTIDFPTGGDDVCVRFWYHMYGQHVGAFKVYHKLTTRVPTKPIWERIGSMVNKWVYAQLIVPRRPAFQIVFQGVRGKGYQGDIAVDDVGFVNGPCPPSLQCDYQNGDLCGWAQDADDEFDWSVGNGKTMSTQTGPKADHTYETDFGKYLFIEGSYPRQPGDKARIESFSHRPTKGMCFEFFYHMKGTGIGTLNIWIRRGKTMDSKPVWTLSGEQGDEWYRAKVTLVEDTENWTVIMEGIRGADFNSDIAIDDVIFHQGDCVPQGDCDFENDDVSACGYENWPRNKVDWLIYSGGTPSYNTGPMVDHTLGTKQGHYLYMETSSPAKKGDFGYFMSEKFRVNPNYKWCVDFYYHMFGDGVGSFMVKMMYQTKYSRGRYLLQTLFKKEGNHDDIWQHGQVNITSSYDFQIVFQGVVGGGITHRGDIAIDDITVKKGLCPAPKAPPKPNPCAIKCKDGTCVPSNKVCDFYPDCAQTSDNTDDTDEKGCDGCDFEKGTCNWNDTSKGLFDWNRQNGGTSSYNTGPSVDHTKKNALGYYVYVEASKGQSSDLATLSSPVLNQASSTCKMTFWYHMYGTSIGTLNVYLVNGYRLTLHWTLSGNQGNLWKQGTVYVNRQLKPYSVRFVAERSFSYRGDIAIDDIKFEGCELPRPAGFCNSRYQHRCAVTRACISYTRLCDYTDDCGDGTDELNCRWTQYPYRCNFEYDLCYWRNLKDDDFDFTRQKGQTDSANTGPLFDHTTGTSSGYYIFVETSWPRKTGDKARIGSGYLGPITRTYCILRFYYHMYGDHIGALSVKLRTCIGCPETQIWRRNTTVGNYWVRHAMYLRSDKPFQVIFEAEKGSDYQGDLALDDISFDGCTPYQGTFPTVAPSTKPPPTTSPCPSGKFYCAKDAKCIKGSMKCDYIKDCSDGQDEQHCGPCDFEKDMCGYQDVSIGTLEFKRTQPINDGSKNGPSVDHTTNSTKGYFAMAQKGSGNKGSPVSFLLSAQLSQTAPSCKVQLFYHAKAGANYVRVSHRQPGSNGKTVISQVQSLSIRNMDKWQNDTVGVGQRPVGWQVLIGLLSEYAAIDDIKFIDCFYPRPTGVCNRMYTQCDNGVCLDPEKMCDFSNDCGDNSDEKPSVCKNFKERCDFETDTCNWYQDQSDNFEWKRIKGGTPSGSTGTGTDHTTGTSQGYYMYIEASNPRKPNDTARLLSPVFKPHGNKKCAMRFHYHMFGIHVDSLSVKMKFSQDDNSTMKTVWTKRGNQGNQWNTAKVYLLSKVNFQVVMEARRGISFLGDIAIDDVSFSPDCLPDFKATLNPNPITKAPPPGCKAGQFSCGDGQCIDSDFFCNFKQDCKNNADEIRCPSSCDFEGGKSCNWFNAKFGDIMDWTVHQGKTPTNGTGPPYDHTKGTKDGWYAYMEAHQRKASNFPNAHFVSPMYYQGAYDCKFSFWFNMYHYKISVQNDARLNLLYRKNGKDTKIWSMARTTGNKWVQATVQLPRCPRDFRMIFEGHHYWATKTDAAIDDLKFMCTEPKAPSSCANDEFQCTKTKQCIKKHMLCDMDRNCCDGSDEAAKLCKGYKTLDFETGLQQWIQFRNDDFDFDIQSGKTSSSGTGPQTDHTLEEEHGKYIFIESSLRNENETANLGSPTLAATTSSLYASGDCSLRFWYHMYGSHIGSLTVYTATTFGVPETQVWQLSGDQGNTWKRGEVKLDSNKDFQVIFEAKMGTSYKGDISLDDISLTPGCVYNNAVLPGGPTPPPVDPCLPNFQCNEAGNCVSRAKVCDFVVDCSDGSDESNATCGYPQGFEYGFGAWRNAHFDTYDFTLQQGATPSIQTGPTTDAKNDKKGYYAFLEVSNRKRSRKAVLSSPTYAVAYSQCVLSFYYHMYGRETGILKVHLVTTNETTLLFELKGEQGNKWIKTKAFVGRRYHPFYLNFTATVGSGYRGDIAIDEISFENCAHPQECTGVDPGKFRCKNGFCINQTEICNAVDDCGDDSDEHVGSVCENYLGCTFENLNDPCNFTQAKSGDDFDWKLNRGWTGSYNTGPTRDHTKGTSKGSYMYIEASGRVKGQKARLISLPVESRPGGNCQVRFFYHMFGKHINDLNVYILQSGTLRLIKNANGDYGDMWREASLDLSKEKGVYRLVFEGVVGASYLSDIAIDDIIFNPDCMTNGSRVFPTRIPCAANQFTCTNTRQCLSSSVRCNGVRDCRDGSDETGCKGPDTGKSSSVNTTTSIYASGVVGGLVILLIAVLIIYIVVKRKREKKLQLFSVFYDPTKQAENEKKQGKPSKNVTIKNEGVSNPIYDEQPMSEFSMGELDTNMFTDEPYVVPAEPKGQTSSMANPLYQDPYMEDDDSPLSNF